MKAAQSNLQPSAESVTDVFTFSPEGRLDSYNRYTGTSPINAMYKESDRTIAVITGNHPIEYIYNNINSTEGFRNQTLSLFYDDYKYPFMSGETSCNRQSQITIQMTPIISEIVIRSIRCDFSGKTYSLSQLEDIRIYLTNVNATYAPFATETKPPINYINAHMLRLSDQEAMKHPEMTDTGIIPNLSIGNQTVTLDKHLYCYPNTITSEGPSNSYTRLVIEGKINGHKWYYPISINRHNKAQDGQVGVGRNKKYIYDIVLRGTGTTNPDTDISPVMADIRGTIENWNERNETEIIF